MADPDLELRERGVDLLVLLAFLPSVTSSFLAKIRGLGPLDPSPRSATDNRYYRSQPLMTTLVLKIFYCK